jgi:hypothetical protein
MQVLDWRALQTLVALAWVTAGFLYRLRVTFQWAEVYFGETGGVHAD